MVILKSINTINDLKLIILVSINYKITSKENYIAEVISLLSIDKQI